MGGIRASAQMISYELAMGLAVIPVIMLANSMNLGVITESQRGMWYIFLQPLAAFIFFLGILAELERAPFDLLEAEQELSSGFNVEYGGHAFWHVFHDPIHEDDRLQCDFCGFISWWLPGPVYRSSACSWIRIYCSQDDPDYGGDDLDSGYFAPAPLRSIDGPGLEETAAHWPGECRHYRHFHHPC